MLSVPPLDMLYQDVQTAFAMFDTDDSGSIDMGEFQALFDALKASNPSASAIRAGRTGFKGGPT